VLKQGGNPFRVVLLLAVCIFWLPQASPHIHGNGEAGKADLRASSAPAVAGSEVKAEERLPVAASFEPLLLLLLGSVLLLLASGIKLSLSRRVKILRDPLLKN
jgi:hypothetical protein